MSESSPSAKPFSLFGGAEAQGDDFLQATDTEQLPREEFSMNSGHDESEVSTDGIRLCETRASLSENGPNPTILGQSSSAYESVPVSPVHASPRDAESSSTSPTETSTTLRLAETEVERLRGVESRLMDEKGNLEKELGAMMRKLDVAEKERDESVGVRYVLQSEVEGLKLIVQQRQSPSRRDRSMNTEALEQELVKAKLELAEAFGRIDVLENARRETESRLVEAKCELARQRSEHDDQCSEVEYLRRENQLLRQELMKLMSKPPMSVEQAAGPTPPGTVSSPSPLPAQRIAADPESPSRGSSVDPSGRHEPHEPPLPPHHQQQSQHGDPQQQRRQQAGLAASVEDTEDSELRLSMTRRKGAKLRPVSPESVNREMSSFDEWIGQGDAGDRPTVDSDRHSLIEA